MSMNTVPERLAALRAAMAANGVAVYLIPVGDPHASEYLPAHYTSLTWFSGFHGENSNLVVTRTGSALWADGRYFVQAEKELAGTEIELQRMGEPGVPTVEEYCANALNEGEVLGLCGLTASTALVNGLKKALEKKGASIRTLRLEDELWTEGRPALPDTPEWAAVRGGAAAGSDAARCAAFARSLSVTADTPAAEPASSRCRPLRSIFSHLNGEHPGYSVPAARPDGALHDPVQDAPDIPAAVYRELYQELTGQLTGLQFSPAQANALLGLLESQCSALPASTARDEDRDISLYDQLKLTAALAACVSEYLQQADAFSLLDTPAELRREPAFLLYTADFSRIQRFIYTVHTEGALRSLRSRSFFLELLMEHYMDELLDGCGLPRTNIIYSGGGHCYLLLPNTATVQQTLADWNRAFNGWLNEQFGVQLFLANGWTPCSANDLCNVPAEVSPYKALFRRVNAIAEQHKQHPYDAAALRALNRVQAIPDGTRECKVCGNSAQVNAEGLCPWCNRFANLSAQIQNQSIYLVHSTPRPGAFALPGIRGSKRFLSFSNDSALCADAVRSYTKNRLVRTLSPSINLFVGDYAASNNIEDLADQSEGIRRVAICRMDVDNLGQAFIAGFEQPDQTDPVQRMKYVNLFRAAAFSRQMSLFFKYHINGLLQGLCVSIVYAGGDDVFLVGAWNHTLQAALRIQKHLRSYTCGALTISAGIAMFNEHYPIRAAAEQTAALEDEAKKLPGKNGAALFDAVPDHTYSWDVLQDKVLGEKMACLEQFFAQFQKNDDDDHRGNSMLYNLTDLLRNTQKDHVNFARCVYLLARLRPDEKKASEALKDAYRTFSHNVLDWARDPEQRRQLITAIYIYVYQKRGRE